MAKEYKFVPYILFVASIAAIGGFLLGFNQTVVAGALIFLEKDFHLSVFQQELIVSILLLGALFGASFGGMLADKVGRKTALFFTTVCFLIGTLIIVLAHSLMLLLIGRLVCGFAVGVVSLVVPLYIAEMADPTHRGALVSLNQLAITLGILLAYVINYVFADISDWKAMFGVSFIPTLVLFIGLFFIPETPSYLLSKGKKAKAEKVFKKIKHKTVTEETSISKTEAGWKQVFQKRIRPALIVGIGMSLFQQLSGINGILFYAPKIFQKASLVLPSDAILASISIGVINVLMTVVALWLIDLIGRRFLLITGLSGMVIALAILGFAFLFLKEYLAIVSIICIISYIAFFAISLGPVPWLLFSEIFPLSIRGKAMSIAFFVNWIVNYSVSLTLLTLLQNLGAGKTFWLYAVFCLLALYFVIRKVPETKNKSFKQIQDFFKLQVKK